MVQIIFRLHDHDLNKIKVNFNKYTDRKHVRLYQQLMKNNEEHICKASRIATECERNEKKQRNAKQIVLHVEAWEPY